MLESRLQSLQDSLGTANKGFASSLETVLQKAFQANANNTELLRQVSSILEGKVAQLKSKVETFDALLKSMQHCGARADGKDASTSTVPASEAAIETVAMPAATTGDVAASKAAAAPASGPDAVGVPGEWRDDDLDFDSSSDLSIFEDSAFEATGPHYPTSCSSLPPICQDALLAASPPIGWVASEPHVGDIVLISGLVKATQYNSKSGVIVEEVDNAGRVAVRFGPSRPPARIRLQNVFFPAFCPFCGAEVTSGHCMACREGSQMILHDSYTSKPPLSGDAHTPNTHSMTHKDFNSAASSTPASALAAVKGTSSQLHDKCSSHSSHDT